MSPVAVLSRADDRILVVARGNRVLLTARLEPDGQLDRTYGTEGKFSASLPADCRRARHRCATPCSTTRTVW